MSNHRKAFEVREGISLKQDTEGMDLRRSIGGILGLFYGTEESFIRSERWKNERRYNKKRPSIGEIVAVEINKTADTGENVITLVGVNGERVSLWCSGSRVRSITNY